MWLRRSRQLPAALRAEEDELQAAVLGAGAPGQVAHTEFSHKGWPPKHRKPRHGHTFPQVPQFISSSVRFLQPPPQQVFAAPLQSLPQVPQFVSSVMRFTHAVPHTVSPAPAQLQVPALQLCGRVHVVPQLPQLVGSVMRLAQIGPQEISLVPGQRHMPPLQSVMLEQTLSQVPQLLSLA